MVLEWAMLILIVEQVTMLISQDRGSEQTFIMILT